MDCIQHFVLNTYDNTDSSLEKVANFLLSPAKVFGGRRFVYFKNDLNEHCYEKPEIESPNFLVNVIKKIQILGLILLPLGLLLKGAAYITHEKSRFAIWASLDLYTAPYGTPPGQKLINIYQECIKKNFRKEFYFELVANPTDYLIPPHFFNNNLTFPPLNLGECGCCNTQEFNRFFTDRRLNIEERITTDLKKVYLEKQGALNLLGFGSGRLLEDWILIGKLIKEGITEINYTIVEPHLHKEALENFTAFFADFEGVKINIKAYKNLEEYRNEPNNLQDAVFAIDFDEFDSNKNLKELNQTRDLLTDTGHLYLSYSKDDMVIGKSDLECYGRKSTWEPITSDLRKSFSLDCPKNFQIAQSNNRLCLNLMAPILYELISKKVESIEIFIQDRQHGDVEYYKLIDNELKENLESFSNKETKVKVNFIDDISQFTYDIIATPDNEALSTNAKDQLKETGVAYVLTPTSLDRLTKEDRRSL